jgi:hypothetical protein
MNHLDQMLTQIAHDHLGIPTLQPRASDALDFHEIAVWQIRNALAAAFNAGVEATELPARFDIYQIQPCQRFPEPDDPSKFYFEVCEPHEAHVWTLYGHIPGQGVEAIGDFATREFAEEVFARLTGRRYGT